MKNSPERFNRPDVEKSAVHASVRLDDCGGVAVLRHLLIDNRNGWMTARDLAEVATRRLGVPVVMQSVYGALRDLAVSEEFEREIRWRWVRNAWRPVMVIRAPLRARVTVALPVPA